MVKKLKPVTVDRYHADNHIPDTSWVWVFAADAGGKHKAGSAKIARTNFRAEYSCSSGLTQKAYAICFFDKKGDGLPRADIEKAVGEFLAFVNENPGVKFFVPDFAKECAIAVQDLAQWFKDAPQNCALPEAWKQ